MNDQALVIQQPEAEPRQLILLLHGVGGRPQDLQAMAQALAARFPQALIVCLAAPDAAEQGDGRQWFSTRDITDENRPGRVDAAMPALLALIQNWQRQAGLSATETALIGFSQGAIMALASAQLEVTPAKRIVSIAGRCAVLPEALPADVVVHLLHGRADTVIPYAETVRAAHRLRTIGADFRADVFPHIGHEPHPEMVDCAVDWLATHVPRALWKDALSSAPQSQSSSTVH